MKPGTKVLLASGYSLNGEAEDISGNNTDSFIQVISNNDPELISL